MSAALCLFVLHVLSQEQQRHLLRRLRRCAAPGALLVGSCVGVGSHACPWGVTPDGTGQPRRAAAYPYGGSGLMWFSTTWL